MLFCQGSVAALLALGGGFLVLVVLLTGCTGGLPPVTHPGGEKTVQSEDSFLLNQSLQRLGSTGDQSGFYMLDSGREAFLYRAALTEAAEHRIDAQYYIWNNDGSGRYLAGRLLLAADRDVRIRLLLDDFNIEGIGELFAALDTHPNIDVRIFNPATSRSGWGRWVSFLMDFKRINRRMHNKTFVVDGSAGIVGGRNIGDEYFGFAEDRYFRDRDVLALGAVVDGMAENFQAYWNNRWAYPVSALYPEVPANGAAAILDRLRRQAGTQDGIPVPAPTDSAQGRSELAELFHQLTLARGELVFDSPSETMDGPGKTPKRSAKALQRLARASTEEILIESAYLILTGEQLALLDVEGRQGLEVAALTNSLASNDLVTNHSGYARWRPYMLRRGIRIHELKPDAEACQQWLQDDAVCSRGEVSLHSKSVVFDRSTLVVGSFNVNLRSIYLNGETVLIIHSAEMAERVAKDIRSVMQPRNSWEVSLDESGEVQWRGEKHLYTSEPTIGWWTRAQSRFLSWLPIEKYL
ncbi:phospholipase [Marinobacter vulgaris]|uniref:Phospholipase n=1 Tax=Marinobacter vulgaris TaxID=1928331 RepID=A0A2V3ZMJ9_9GAMM|nr:phospholipase D family protein [Marinobacter vulgaris]PXX90408.1 phospholipase [Marinobacter vulgaris]TSJ69565.1 phospholipase D family protein [Marinobacter vulgaris]